jgi:hypothetical protein
MKTVPVVNPAATPFVEPIVAVLMFALLQVPPVVAFVSVVLLPAQVLSVPTIAAGGAPIVIVFTDLHPVTAWV